jgi:hypothetical protein
MLGSLGKKSILPMAWMISVASATPTSSVAQQIRYEQTRGNIVQSGPATEALRFTYTPAQPKAQVATPQSALVRAPSSSPDDPRVATLEKRVEELQRARDVDRQADQATIAGLTQQLRDTYWQDRTEIEDLEMKLEAAHRQFAENSSHSIWFHIKEYLILFLYFWYYASIASHNVMHRNDIFEAFANTGKKAHPLLRFVTTVVLGFVVPILAIIMLFRAHHPGGADSDHTRIP